MVLDADLQGFTAIQKQGKKGLTWDLIRNLHVNNDVNEILSDDEKLGGLRRDRKLIDDFRHCLDDCGLRDLKPSGEIFTWYGNRRGIQIWERIDRFLSNSSFDNKFSHTEVRNLEWFFSDHKPIEIQLLRKRNKALGRRNNQFKFEEFWTRHEVCEDLIKDNGDWRGNNSFASSLPNCLQECSEVLSKWGKGLNSNRKIELQHVKGP